MEEINYNVELSDDLHSRSFAIASKKFSRMKEYHIGGDYNIKSANKMLSYLQSRFEYGKLTTSTYLSRPNEFENNIVEYVKNYMFISENIIMSFTVENDTLIKATPKEILDEYDAQNSEDDAIVRTTNINIYYNDNRPSNQKEDTILEDIINILKKDLSIKEKLVFFYTIGMSRYGYSLVKSDISSLPNYDDKHLKMHYGDDFMVEYNDIKNNLKTKNYGLMLLYGEPGTGKTTLIRQLIKELCPLKKLIYIPSYMVEKFADPDFITFLKNIKNSIMILEDAENILKSRDGSENRTQAVSNLLNITDGLLNDSLNTQVIATFNMNKTKIDAALLRPGRLLNEWEFNKLSIENTKKLVKHLNLDLEVNREMTVSEIYYYKDYIKQNNKENSKPKIGF